MAEQQATPPKSASLICFSDIDGTIVHYPSEQEKWGSYTGVSVVPGCALWVDKVIIVIGLCSVFFFFVRSPVSVTVTF